jgi:hypothetical protein
MNESIREYSTHTHIYIYICVCVYVYVRRVVTAHTRVGNINCVLCKFAICLIRTALNGST